MEAAGVLDEAMVNANKLFAKLPDDALLTRGEASKILRINVGTLANWACLDNSALRITVVGNMPRYTAGAIREYIESGIH